MKKVGSRAREVIKSITEVIKDEYQPDKVVLYGSYAYGNPDPGSDIDILIIKDTRERPIDRRIKVRGLVSDKRSGFAFSPLVITPRELKMRLEIGDQFIAEVLEKGKVLYGE